MTTRSSILFRRLLNRSNRIHLRSTRSYALSNSKFQTQPLSVRHPNAFGSSLASFQSPRIQFFSTTTPEVAEEATERIESEPESYPRFADLTKLHPTTAQTLAQRGFETMTEIQAKTYDVAIQGKDVIGRARTGTGKSLAFLLPSLERVLRNPIPDQVNVLIISPTRELASQIADQADMLTRNHNGISSQVIYGGTPKYHDVRRMERQIPTILTATPGRLFDHLQSTLLRGNRFPYYLRNMQVLVLDEMDRLLDMGFRQDIQEILRYLPQERQTLLFSATVPDEVKSIIRSCTKEDSVLVDCIDDEDPASHTNERVNQKHVILPSDKVVSGVVQVVTQLMQEPDHKVLVFFPTTSQVSYFSTLFNHGLGRRVLEIHSKKSQNARTNTSDRFRRARKGVMFTSDVSARGIDYPDVTHVIQVGMTRDRETYIHRLGRTGRAGKKGEGLLMLTEHERNFLEASLDGLEIPRCDYTQGLLSEPLPSHVETTLEPVLNAVRVGNMFELNKAAEAVYRSMLGYYKGQLPTIGVQSSDALLQMVNDFASQAGLQSLPPLSEKLARQFGLHGHPGVNIRRSWQHGSGFDVGRGRGRNGNGNASDRGGFGSNAFRWGQKQPDSWGQGQSSGWGQPDAWGQDFSYGRGRGSGNNRRSGGGNDRRSGGGNNRRSGGGWNDRSDGGWNDRSGGRSGGGGW